MSAQRSSDHRTANGGFLSKHRTLAEEYDAAQPEDAPINAASVGLRRDEIHEARKMLHLTASNDGRGCFNFSGHGFRDRRGNPPYHKSQQ